MAQRVKRTQLKGRKAPAKPKTSVVQERSENHLGYGSASVNEENKNQRLELRLTKLQKEVISKASRVRGFKNVSDYILHLAISDSKIVIREQQIFELSERDRISFLETLENPGRPGKNLKKAMKNYLSFNKESE